MIDLHTHTDASDGCLSLPDLIAKAEKKHLKALAITDHDTVENAKNIKNIDSQIEIIPGIELSVYDNALGYLDIHVVGLFINPESPQLASVLELADKARDDQKKQIIKKLNSMGYEISYSDAKKYAKNVIGRPHIAMAMLDNYPEEFHSISDVFSKLLAKDKPAFATRTYFFTLSEAINIIKSSGGLAILAHPAFYDYETKNLLLDFKECGGDGVETFYDYVNNKGSKLHTPEDNKKIYGLISSMANELDLLQSGGSDFHGTEGGSQLGSPYIPYSVLKTLRNAL